MTSQKFTIYHNPRCSKSRQTLQLIEQAGIQPEIIQYLKTPLESRELKKILKLLGMSPRELMRKKEAPYKELGLDRPEVSEKDLLQAIVDHPILLERPIVIAGEQAVIGRPPENVLPLLGQGT
ncbi:MAG: arsenate reductase (glutaredoxin) [Xanthomonadales bacterium]|nr:arsenate reductase (glutaredoxin) [Xanthomonadales bacterium]